MSSNSIKITSCAANLALIAVLGFILFNPTPVRGVSGSFTVGTNLVAQTRLVINVDSDNAVVITVYIDRLKDKDTGVTGTIPGGIGSYSATATASSGIQILPPVRGVAPYVNPSFDAGTGVFSVTSVASPQQANNSAVAKLVIRLTGNALTVCTLNIAFHQIIAASDPGLNVPEEAPQSMSLTFLRGDANGNGVVNIADAMFIAQYLVGIRPLSDIMLINAASVKQDGSIGDTINIADAMFIAQYLVGLRDANYNLK